MQLFARREKVHKARPERKWKELSSHFMIKESGGESSEKIVWHELPRTSDSEFYCIYIHHLCTNTYVEAKLYSRRCKEVHGKTGQVTPVKPRQEGEFQGETWHPINSASTSGLKQVIREEEADHNLSEEEMDSPADEEEQSRDSITYLTFVSWCNITL